jgi:16S rRNA (guanine527-N7)-methyltransferase
VAAATKARLTDGARSLGVTLGDEAIAKLLRYLDLLLTWNRKINLTAVTDPIEIVDRHFLDSLAVLPALGESSTLIDVGSGAGFPGAVLAIARPELRVTCVESIRKKVAFLDTLRAQLAPNLEPLCLRIEALRDRQFDAVISRATWDPAEWLTHGAPLVAPAGRLIAMQTADAPTLTAPSGFTALAPLEYEIACVRRKLQSFVRNG